MDEFKNDIKLYIKCDNVIKEFNEKAAAMREQRGSYSIRIMRFMNEHEMGETKLSLPRFNSTLKIGNHSNQESLSYSFLYNTFINYFGDPVQAENLLNYIKESRKKEQKHVLVRNTLKEK